MNYNLHLKKNWGKTILPVQRIQYVLQAKDYKFKIHQSI